jgi:tRNA pseudouridine55 synthase
MVGLGQACRFADLVNSTMPKTYLAKGLIGIETDTGDLTGSPMVSDWPPSTQLEADQFSNSISLFTPRYAQSVPHFSAAKFEGKALYKWARQGIKIERPAVERDIYQLSIKQIAALTVDFRATVSSGTYIRQLWQDWAEKCGHRGHLTQLRRVAIGEFLAENALSVEAACQLLKNELPKLSQNSACLEIEHVLNFPRLNLNGEASLRRFLTGARLRIIPENFVECPDQLFGSTWITWQGKVIGYAQVRNDAACYPQIVFGQPEQEIT